MSAPSITQANIRTVVRAFLLAILPPGVEVIRGQVNRVAEPSSLDFVVMTPVMANRLETNTTTYSDVVFTGSIAPGAAGQPGTLTVASLTKGVVGVGAPISGPGVASGTYVTAQLNSNTFAVQPSQTVASGQLYAGARQDLTPFEQVIQLDVHGPNSGENATVIASLWRSEYACTFFEGLQAGVDPLYAKDPRQVPFISGEAQYDDRWIVDVSLQANPLILTAQDFAAAITVNAVPVR